VFVGFDLVMWAFAALHAALAVRTGRHRPRVKAVARSAAGRRVAVREAEEEST
jgi:hypothetical protein